jgi:hypothetical protein
MRSHSGPQGRVVPLTIIDDPADWKSKDWEGREAEYTYAFSAHDVAELHAAVATLKARGIATEDDILAVSAIEGEQKCLQTSYYTVALLQRRMRHRVLPPGSTPLPLVLPR